MIDQSLPAQKKVTIKFKDKTEAIVTVDKVEARDGFLILHYPKDRQVYYPAHTIDKVEVTPA